MDSNTLPAQDIATLYEQGANLERSGESLRALEIYNAVLEMNPAHLPARAGKAWMLFSLGKPEAARPLMQSVVDENPNVSAWQTNLGAMLKHGLEYDAALRHLKQAIDLDPSMFPAYYNLAAIHMDRGHFDKAHRLLSKAIERGDQGAARYYQCMLYFLENNLPNALKLWEWRFRHVDAVQREWPFPRWNGEPIPEGKKLLLWAEQGIGDELMFASLLPGMLSKNIPVLLDASERLVSLFKRSFGIEVAPHTIEGCRQLLHDPRIAYQAPIGDMLYYSAPEKSYPVGNGYLKADESLVQEFRGRYTALGAGAKIGISWYSSNYTTGCHRSISLQDWLPVLKTPGVKWVSVQYGNMREEIAALKRDHGIDVYLDESVDAMTDMDRFAAQVASLDRVVSVANSTVHMAGGLGVPVWVPLPEIPSWRWQRYTKESLWYSHIRLFRQKKMFLWDETIAAIAAALEAEVKNN